MENRRAIEFRIGVVVMATILVLVVMIIMFGPKRISFLSGDYKINVLFPHAPMITPDSQVFKNGVEIGRVSTTELVEDDRMVKVVLLIHNNVKIYDDEECRINANILGQASISFRKTISKGDGFRQAKVLPADSTIYGIAPTDIVQLAGTLENQITTALQEFTNATKEVSKSFAGINTMIGTPEEIAVKQKRLEGVVDEVMKTMASIEKLSTGLESIVNDPDIQKNLKNTAKDVPKIMGEVQHLMQSAEGMIADISGILGQVNQTFGKVDSNLDNIERFTESLGSDGPAFMDKLTVVANNMEKTVAELKNFTTALNNPNGSIGQLLDSPDFFNRMQRTMKNVEDITVQVKPVLTDARVLSDKLARDPALLGVKGVFAKSPPTKGTPETSPVFVGAGGEFREAIPQFQLDTSPKLRPFPFRRPQYKYVIPQPMSYGHNAEYIEHPAQPTELLESYSHASPPVPQYHSQVPVYRPKPAVSQPPVAAVPDLTEMQMKPKKFELDFTPTRSSNNYEVTPLPVVETGAPLVVSKGTGQPTLRLDFTPAASR